MFAAPVFFIGHKHVRHHIKLSFLTIGPLNDILTMEKSALVPKMSNPLIVYLAFLVALAVDVEADCHEVA